MSEDKTSQISDQTEQEVWDLVINTIYQLAQMAQKIRFNKYKLNFQLETNTENNHLSTISNLENIVIAMTNKFHKDYQTQLKIIDDLYKTHANKPRILLMLDAAKDKLQTLLTYNELKEPTLVELQNKIQTIQHAPAKQDDITPTQSNN